MPIGSIACIVGRALLSVWPTLWGGDEGKKKTVCVPKIVHLTASHSGSSFKIFPLRKYFLGLVRWVVKPLGGGGGAPPDQPPPPP